MKQPLDALATAVSRRIAPSTGIATGLVAPLALAAPGNLDAGFADHGRLMMEAEYGGQAWSVEALDDGKVFVAGGDVEAACSYFYYYCDYYGSNFAGELTGAGQVDRYFTSTGLGIEVRDAIRQPDGKVIMVGRRLEPARELTTLVVYRLAAGGSLDTTFGSEGIFDLPAGDYGTRHTASSATQDPDGRIVVSGSSDGQLIVLRLLADGTLDPSFGENGVFVGPLHDHEARTFVERTADAGYRITATSEAQCRIVGLTAAGAMDDTFGTAGIAPVVSAQGGANSCSSMASQADGSLLLSGTTDGHAFATRILATGASDAAFLADAVAAAMTEATAIAVDSDGKIVVAGSGEPGAMVMRLSADGAVDPTFGEAGTTLIDLPSENGSQPRINALDVRADGRVLAAGGDSYSGSPFVVQLLADGGAASPGVLGFAGPNVDAAEGSQVVVKVRRTGGKSGSVSVEYEMVSDGALNTSDEDYGKEAGTLTWSDGDASEREIVVPIHADSDGPEEYEAFQIQLGDPQGGAGLGKKNEVVSILPDGAPGGQFAVYETYGDEAAPAEVVVYRNFYSEGAVSVTVTPVAGSADAGDDFDASPVTLHWADGDSEPKVAADRDRRRRRTGIRRKPHDPAVATDRRSDPRPERKRATLDQLQRYPEHQRRRRIDGMAFAAAAGAGHALAIAAFVGTPGDTLTVHGTNDLQGDSTHSSKQSTAFDRARFIVGRPVCLRRPASITCAGANGISRRNSRDLHGTRYRTQDRRKPATRSDERAGPVGRRAEPGGNHQTV